jgi:hypothetical protein
MQKLNKNIDFNNVLFDCIDKFNKTLTLNKKIKKNNNQILLGKKTKLDSLEIVTFFTLIEDEFNKKYNIRVNILEIYFSEKNQNKLKNIENLMKSIKKIHE